MSSCHFDLCAHFAEHVQRSAGIMGAVRLLAAGTVFLVFGSFGFAMGRTALNDWREGRRDRDALSLWTAVEALWPTMIALGIALVGPVVILFQD